MVSGCLETPKGKLPSINQAEIDMEAERQKRLSYAKYIDQMSLVKSINFFKSRYFIKTEKID